MQEEKRLESLPNPTEEDSSKLERIQQMKLELKKIFHEDEDQ